MADLNSNEYQQAYVDDPKSQLLPGRLNGRERRIYVEADVAAEFAAGEKITFCKLPANAEVFHVRVVSPNPTALAGGLLDIGWAAGAEGLESASADGFIANIATDSAVDATMDISSSASGFAKRFQEEVNVEGVFTVQATTALTGQTVKLEIGYVID